MSGTTTLLWNGGQHTIVALDREVFTGEEVDVPDELVDQMLAVHGFTLPDGSNPLAEEAPEIADRAALEENATLNGLAIYPTEADEDLAGRIKAAGGDPSLTDPAKAMSEPAKEPTPKERAEARAAELGLEVTGTKADLEKAIATEEERLAQDQGGSGDGAGS